MQWAEHTAPAKVTSCSTIPGSAYTAQRVSVDGDTHLITENRDTFGRSTGYTYTKNGAVQQTVTTGYGDDGRISTAGFVHGGQEKLFGYTYLQGTDLLQTLTKPNGMSLTQSYEPQRDLLTQMGYRRGNTLVAQRSYTYDILGRPTARDTARQGSVVNDTFAHSTRSELVAAQVNGKNYEYTYDNIGNRTAAVETSSGVVSRTEYQSNNLNQYTAVNDFTPEFDLDGNQMRIKTATGIWAATYNAENRPVTFSNSESNTVVECAYDCKGRRAYKKVLVNGSVTLHQRYIYRGYLQIACVDLTRSHHPAMWFITWDPTQPTATRPLAIQKDGTWYTYGWDITKNICEIFGPAGYIRTVYTYSPYGKVSVNGDTEQSIQWNGEYFDIEMGLTCYNWRLYNPIVGKWLVRDFVRDSFNVYSAYKNNSIMTLDVLGLWNDGNYGDLNKNDRTRGHSDFYGHERFDYTKADSTYNPLLPVFTFMHFRPINVSENNIKRAIKTCNVELFEMEMHFMQDFFAHYGQGFRAAPVIFLGLGAVMITLAGQFVIYGDFGHAATSIFGDNALKPDDAWIYRDAFEQANEQSIHWVRQWDKCCKLVNAETRIYKPNPCCSISNGKQYGEKAAPPSKNNTLTPFEEKELMKIREQESIRLNEEYYRHYVLPQMMDAFFHPNY